MRVILIGIALCGAVPALASEVMPVAASFAYPLNHSSDGDASDYANAPPPPPAPPPQAQPPAEIKVATAAAGPPSAPALSRNDLCTAAIFEAAANNLPIRFFANLIHQESGFNIQVVSHKGAQGIAQFMPYTAAERELKDPFDPIPALNASAKFLAELVDRFGNLGLAAAAYNAGPRRVDDWLAKRGELPAETQHYVRVITGIAAEKWADPASKGTEIRMPPHSRCPGLRLASADPAVEIKLATADTGARFRGRGRGGRYSKYGWFRSRYTSLTYVSLR
jgi:hypothetical protein